MIDQLGTPTRKFIITPATEFVAGFIGDINKLTAVVTEKNKLLCYGKDVLADTKNITTGKKVKLFIRPEHIDISSNDGMEGKIIQKPFFAGTHSKNGSGFR